MKLNCLILLLTIISFNSYSQTAKVSDYKIKSAANEKDRTEILNVLRAKLYKEWKQEFIFEVQFFKVGNNYAWFMGSVERKDGKPLVMPDDSYDCCHAECLFKKQNGKWTVLQGAAFSTDAWFQNLDKKYPDAPKGIFDKGGVLPLDE